MTPQLGIRERVADWPCVISASLTFNTFLESTTQTTLSSSRSPISSFAQKLLAIGAGSARPVSSTTTQSIFSRCAATMSSMAAMPRSLTLQHRHPLGRASMLVVGASAPSEFENCSALAWALATLK